MYQTGMNVKNVLEAFSSGMWNAGLKYDCGTARYTARLQLKTDSPEAPCEKAASFAVCPGDPEEGSLRIALQLWLVLSELERELLTEHADALIRESVEKNQEAELNRRIREAVCRLECSAPDAL